MPNIRVAVRVRPLSERERARDSHPCIMVQEGTQINVVDPDDKMGGIDYLRLDKNRDKAYAFDAALDDTITQQEVFEITTKNSIPGVVKGTNACCFAYGATGSGKTYTMTGTKDAPGVIPLTVEALFEEIRSSAQPVHVTVQYVEIYNEVVKDLLDPAPKLTNLDVREDPRQGTFVAGAATLEVMSREEVEELLAQGNFYRTTSATGCNEVSSRSHAVLQLRLEAQQEAGAKAIGKLALIDLAGSERATKTDNRGERLNEGANINRSLLALANCINALVGTGGRGHSHVPYRDSKLTRLLKDSLGGSSCTCIITNVSPASDQFEETINTLKYANRAKNIKTKAISVRVERPQVQQVKAKFTPTVKYDPVAPVKVRGVEDFLVRHEKARVRRELAGLKRGPPVSRIQSSPSLNSGRPGIARSTPYRAGGRGRGMPRRASDDSRLPSIQRQRSPQSDIRARVHSAGHTRTPLAAGSLIDIFGGSNDKKQKVGPGVARLQRAIKDQLTIMRHDVIEKRIAEAKREEEQRMMQRSFGGTQARFL